MDHGNRYPIQGKEESVLCLWDLDGVTGVEDLTKIEYGYNPDLHYRASELKAHLQPLADKGVICNVVLGQCKSGGFVEPLSTLKNTVITTSCEAKQSSHTFWVPDNKKKYKGFNLNPEALCRILILLDKRIQCFRIGYELDS